MLKVDFRTSEALKRLCTDNNGAVSFEYVIVAACVLAAVGAAFGGDGSPIKDALTTALNKIGTAVDSAVGS